MRWSLNAAVLAAAMAAAPAAAQHLSGDPDAGERGDGRKSVQLVDRTLAAQLVQRNGGSLLRAALTAAPDGSRAKGGGVSFFSVPEPEPRTIKKHDLVTIIIREEAEYSSEGSSDLKKDASLEARIDKLVAPKLGGGKLTTGDVFSASPEVRMGGARSFKGEATVERTDSFITRITAEVVDVKPNGTFAVQARKRIKHNEEEQEYVLTGICRAADLTADNTILSTQVHNMEITTKHKGAVRDNTKRGWVPKLLDFVNPF